MKRSFRLLLAAGLTTAALGAAAPPASAMKCAEGFEAVCLVIGLPCYVLPDNPKLDPIVCPGLA